MTTFMSMREKKYKFIEYLQTNLMCDIKSIWRDGVYSDIPHEQAIPGV